jgi:hypothetical protein
MKPTGHPILRSQRPPEMIILFCFQDETNCAPGGVHRARTVSYGDSWNNDADNCASSNRNNNNPSNRNNNYGFRMVLAPAHPRGQWAARLNRTLSRPADVWTQPSSLRWPRPHVRPV